MLKVTGKQITVLLTRYNEKNNRARIIGKEYKCHTQPLSLILFLSVHKDHHHVLLTSRCLVIRYKIDVIKALLLAFNALQIFCNVDVEGVDISLT